MPRSKSTATAPGAKAPADSKPAPKSEPKKPATKKAPKYDEATVAVTRHAQEIRGRKNAVASVTIQRVQATLKAEGKTADQVVKSFKTIKEAAAYAGGDKTVKTPALVAEVSKANEDPFGRGRGLVAICLATTRARAL